MIDRMIFCLWLLLAFNGSVMAQQQAVEKPKEMVCVVIHQTGFIRNPTPDELARGMRVPCDETTDSNTALYWYLAHGGH